MKFIIGIFLLILCSCASFQQVQLEQTDPANGKLLFGKMPSSDVLLINNTGIVDNFNTNEILWKSSSKKLFMDVLSGKLRLKADSSSYHEDYIYRDFNPLNFTKAGEIQITLATQSPNFRQLNLIMVDEDSVAYRLVPSKPTETMYSYKLPEQNDSLDLNLERINRLELRPVAEAGTFTGRVEIDEIKVVK